MFWDQRAVDDPRVGASVWDGLQFLRYNRHQVMDYPIDGRLAGCEQCGQGPGRQVGVQVDQHQQHSGCQRQAPTPPRGGRQPLLSRGAHDAELTGVQAGERRQVSVAVWQAIGVGG